MCKKCVTSSLLCLIKSFLSEHILSYLRSCEKNYRIFHVHWMTACVMEIAMVVSVFLVYTGGYDSIADFNYCVQE